MALPENCRRITPAERTIAAKSLIRQDISQPFFAIYDDAFLDIVGSHPSITLAIEKDHAWAHEAGVYIPSQDAVYITSNRIVTGNGPADQRIIISKVSRQADGEWTDEVLETGVLMGNGGINYKDGILFCDQGTKTSPGGLVYVKPTPPYAAETLIDSYHGRLFNSVNDVVLHTDGSIWFTDPIYAYEQGFKDKPQLPNQVYRYEPDTGDVRVVADGFGRPNGLCFSPDEKTMYITDTDWIHGDGTIEPMRPGTVYAFDVIERHGSQFLANRRLFAHCDNGIPDGIKTDLQGFVYSGCNDGIQVWSPGARLVGKIIIPGGVANFCFTKRGEIVAMNETRLYVVEISEGREGALLKNMGIEIGGRA